MCIKYWSSIITIQKNTILYHVLYNIILYIFVFLFCINLAYLYNNKLISCNIIIINWSNKTVVTNVFCQTFN